MARAKRKPAKVAKAQKPELVPEHAKQQRFPNFLLGLTFVIVVLLLISLFFRNGNSRFTVSDLGKLFTRSNSPTPTAITAPTREPEKAVAGSDYTVRAGDTIWSIAEEAYGSGYNSSDIIAANKLANPGKIEIGTQLILPKVEAKTPTRGEVAGQEGASVTPESGQITPEAQSVKAPAQKEYVVQRGDNLWNIAVKIYGNGFMWTKIAQANNLVNPRVIHSGNRLVLPS